GGESAGRSHRRPTLLDESLQRAYTAEWKHGDYLTRKLRRGGADRDPERPERSEVEPAGRFKRSDRDRWTEAELAPRQASSNDGDDRQEEELQAVQRDGSPATHGATEDVMPDI